jgi:peptidoglycan/LPS O-acetylase OafA/YrhL
MFGTFRFILAFMVVLTHIGGIEIIAGIAVWGFFMLSGFLMTAVLNSKYGFKPNGLARFATSRIIRLYPTYWVSIAISAILIFFLGSFQDPKMINEGFGLPTDISGIAKNITIVGQTFFGLGRLDIALSPSAWAIDVEILMYICSCLFLSRNVRITRITLTVLMIVFPFLWVIAKINISITQPTWAYQLLYSFLPSALLPYAAGSYLYFMRRRVPACLISFLSLPVAIIGIFVVTFCISRFSVTLSYLLSIPFMAVIILNLSRIKVNERLSHIDSMFGFMSYPIYLLHWHCAYMLVIATINKPYSLFILKDHIYRFTPSGFLSVLSITLILSYMFAIFLEYPLEKIRHMIGERLFPNDR